MTEHDDASNPSKPFASGSAHLMVTSPPYNVGKDYEKGMSRKKHGRMLARTWKEAHRILAPGCFACVNVANTGRKPYVPFHMDIAKQMSKAGFSMQGEIIWDKGASV